MEDSAETPPKSSKYWCFISYRHGDNQTPGRQWATWLHQAIETYEVPLDLIGTVNDRGDTIPECIFPVFRDETSLPVDADLATPIYRALDASKFLVVICSPRAVESTYVGAEIRYFKQLGRADRVLAVMVAGEPNASWDEGKQKSGFSPDDECFPEPLRHSVDSEGNLLPARTEPIAADFRLPDGAEEGWTTPEAYRQALAAEGGASRRTSDEKVRRYQERSELMKLKIVAGILGVPLDHLTQRDKAYQLALARKRQRITLWVASALGVLALAAAGASWYAFTKKKDETKARKIAEEQTVLANGNARRADKQKSLKEAESQRRAKLLEDVARADRATASDLYQQGETSSALAYLARAIRNFPADITAAQSAALLLNKWGYLAPWNGPDPGMDRDIDAATFSPSGEWIAAARNAGGSEPAGVSICGTAEPGKHVFLPSPFGDLRYSVEFLDDDRVSLTVDDGQLQNADSELAAPRVWNFREALISPGQSVANSVTIPAKSRIRPTTADLSSSRWSSGGLIAQFVEGRLTIEGDGRATVQATLPGKVERMNGGTFSKDREVFLAAATLKAEAKVLVCAWSTKDGHLLLHSPVEQLRDDEIALTVATWSFSPLADFFCVMDADNTGVAFGVIGADQASIQRIERWEGGEGSFREVAMSPDGLQVAVAEAEIDDIQIERFSVKVFWAPTAELLAETPRRQGFEGGEAEVEWSADSSLLALNASFRTRYFAEVWRAPTASLYDERPAGEQPSPRPFLSWTSALSEGAEVDQFKPGETILRKAGNVVATLRGDVATVEGWISPPGSSTGYVFEQTDQKVLLGRWDFSTGSLLRRVELPIQHTTWEAALFPAENMLIAAGQHSSWVGDANTFETREAFDYQWRTSSTGFLWHATQQAIKRANARVRLFSRLQKAETLAIDASVHNIEAMAFERDGTELVIDADGDEGESRLRIWQLLDTSEPSPDWFPDFLFALSLKDFDAKGTPSYYAGAQGVFLPALISAIDSDQSSYGEWARWFVHRGTSEAEFPGTRQTVASLSAKLIETPSPENLQRAYLLDRDSPTVQTALAEQAPNPVAASLRRKLHPK